MLLQRVTVAIVPGRKPASTPTGPHVTLFPWLCGSVAGPVHAQHGALAPLHPQAAAAFTRNFVVEDRAWQTFQHSALSVHISFLCLSF